MKMNSRNTFYLIFGIFFISMLLLGYYFLSGYSTYSPKFFSDNSAFYFYSALFQANAAIISIFGVFFIFRIQSFQSSIDLIKNGLIADRGRNSWPTEIIEWDGYSLEEKEELLKLDQTNKNNHKNKAIIDQLRVWTIKERNLSNIKSSIIFPTFFIALSMIIEVFCLYSVYFIHNKVLEMEIIIMYTNLVLETSIIVLVVFHIIENIRSNGL